MRRFALIVLAGGLFLTPVMAQPINSSNGPLPKGVARRLGETPFQSWEFVSSIRYTSGGRLLVMSAAGPLNNPDRTVQWLDGRAGVPQLRRSIVFGRPPIYVMDRTLFNPVVKRNSGCFSRGAKLGAVSSWDARSSTFRLEVYGLESGKRIFHRNDFGGEARHLRFSHNGKRLAAVVSRSVENNLFRNFLSEGAHIRIWDVPSGRATILNLKAGGENPTWLRPMAFAWSHDDKRIAVVGKVGRTDGVVRILSTTGGGKSLQLPIKGGAFPIVAFAPNNNVVAVAIKGKLQLWDSASAKIVREMNYPAKECEMLRFSPDGQFIAAGDSGRLCVWRIGDGKRMALAEGATALEFSPDRKRFAVLYPQELWLYDKAGKVTHKWRVRAPTLADELIENAKYARKNAGSALAFSPDGTILCAADDSNRIRRFDVRTGKEIESTRTAQDILYALDFAPNSRLLAVCGARGVALWNAHNGKRVRVVAKQSGRGVAKSYVARVVEFSPDGKRLAVGWDDGVLTLFETATGKLHWRKRPHKTSVRSLRFADGAATLVSLDQNGFVVWQQTTDGEVIRDSTDAAWTVKGNPRPTVLQISHDARQLYIRLRHGKLRVWELASGRIVPIDAKNLSNVWFSPDGRRLLVDESSALSVHDLSASDSTRYFLRTDAVQALFLSNGKRAAIFGADAGLSIHDLDNGDEIGEWKGEILKNSLDPNAIAKSPDGRWLASAGRHGTVLLWDVSKLKAVTPQPLTADERMQLWRDLGSPHGDTAAPALAKFVDDPDAVAFLAKQLTDARLFENPPRRLSYNWMSRALHRLWSSKKRSRFVVPTYQAERALELLERIGSPAAKEVIRRLAKQKTHDYWSEKIQTIQNRLYAVPQAAKKMTPIRRDKTKSLPTGALARLGARRFHHPYPVAVVRALKDGKTLMTITDAVAGKVWVSYWNAATGELIRRVPLTFMSPKSIKDIPAWATKKQREEYLTEFEYPYAISDDNRFLASILSFGNQKLRLYDLRTGKVLWSGARDAVNLFAVQFSPDGQLIACLDDRSPFVIRLFRTSDAVEVGRIRRGVKDTYTVERFWFGPRGRSIVVLCRETRNVHSIRVAKLDPAIPNPKLQLKVTKAKRNIPPAVSPDGRYGAIATKEGKGDEAKMRIGVYDLHTGRRRYDLGIFKDNVVSIAFSPDGNFVIVSAGDVRWWRMRDGKPAAGPRWFGNLGMFSADGKTNVVVTGEHIAVQDVATKRCRLLIRTRAFFRLQLDQYAPVDNVGYPGYSTNVTSTQAFSPDGKRLFVADGQIVRIWNVASGKEFLPENAMSTVDKFAVHGRIAAAVTEDSIALWDVATGKRLRRLSSTVSINAKLGKQTTVADSARIRCLAFSPSGKQLAGGYETGHIVLWDVNTGKRIRTLRMNSSVEAVKFLSRGEVLLTADSEQARTWWYVRDGRRIRTVEQIGEPTGEESTAENTYFSPIKVNVGQDDYLQISIEQLLRMLPDMSVAETQFSPDGRLLAAEEMLVETSISATRWWNSLGGGVVAFSPNNRHAATTSGHGFILHFDFVQGKGRRWFGGMPDGAHVAYSPDGKLLAGAGMDGLIVWDVATGTVLARRTGHGGPATRVAFSRDGRMLFSGGVDQTILIWDVAKFLKRPPNIVPTGKARAALWDDLAALDEEKAWRAQLVLRRNPKLTVALIQQHLKPDVPPNGKAIAQWIDQLNADNFRVRANAMKALKKEGSRARSFLQTIKKRPLTLEHHQRIAVLLERIRRGKLPPSTLRAIRAIAVLETLPAKTSSTVLQRLANGWEHGITTRQARGALFRQGAKVK